MPLKQVSAGPDSYYQWGSRGKKYYYVAGNAASRERARMKAMKQARAIEWSKHKP
jgi:hypothetical protein